MSVAALQKLQEGNERFKQSLSGLRKIVHRVCGLTNAMESCPYRNNTEPVTSEDCASCPLQKEGGSNGKCS